MKQLDLVPLKVSSFSSAANSRPTAVDRVTELLLTVIKPLESRIDAFVKGALEALADFFSPDRHSPAMFTIGLECKTMDQSFLRGWDPDDLTEIADRVVLVLLHSSLELKSLLKLQTYNRQEAARLTQELLTLHADRILKLKASMVDLSARLDGLLPTVFTPTVLESIEAKFDVITLLSRDPVNFELVTDVVRSFQRAQTTISSIDPNPRSAARHEATCCCLKSL